MDGLGPLAGVTGLDADADLQRVLSFEAVSNFRDLGGSPTASGRTVRWRTAFRADGVHRLTVDDLAPLGVRTVVDLRTPGEVEERGRFEHDSIGYHHLPVLERIWDRDQYPTEETAIAYLANRCVEMLDEGAPAIARALRLLADRSALPLVFHCAAGKDRTGVVAAMVLSLLGVSDEDIATDYSLSRLGMDRMVTWLQETYPERAEEMAQQPSAFLEAPVDAMHAFLVLLHDRFGSVDDYVRGLGLSSADVDRLRDNLLER